MDKQKELELLLLEKEKRRRQAAKAQPEQYDKDRVYRDIEQRFIEPSEKLAPVVQQGASFGTSDEIKSGIQAVYKKATGEDKPIGDIFNDLMADERRKIESAREEYPTGSLVAEMVGGVATGRMIPMASGRAAKIAQSAAEGALYGGASAEQGERIEGAKRGALLGGAMSAGGQALGKGAKYIDDALEITKYPKEIMSRYLGATAEDFAQVGNVRDPEKASEDLFNAGLFSGSKTKLNPETMTFEVVEAGSPSRRQTLKNVNNAIKELAPIQKKLLKEVDPRLRFSILPDESGSSLGDYIVKNLTEVELGVDKSKNKKIIEDMLKELRTNFQETMEKKSPYSLGTKVKVVTQKDPNIIGIQKLKQKLQDKARKTYTASKSDPQYDTSSIVDSAIARSFKEFIEDTVEGSTGNKGEFLKTNDMLHKLFIAKGALEQAVNKGKSAGNTATAGSMPVFGSTEYKLVRALDMLMGGEGTMVSRARKGFERAGVVEPNYVSPIGRNVVEETIMQAPQKIMQRNENSRQPQSLVEDLVRLKVPRTTDGIMENKDAILMKIAQQRPEMLQAVQDVMEYEPDQLSDLIPVIAQAMPQIFENDKYGRFDNVILDPAKKQMAKEDTLRDQDLSNSEKMLILDTLNRTGEFYQ